MKEIEARLLALHDMRIVLARGGSPAFADLNERELCVWADTIYHNGLPYFYWHPTAEGDRVARYIRRGGRLK